MFDVKMLIEEGKTMVKIYFLREALEGLEDLRLHCC